jgi:prophage antirepressor-like protein
MKTHEFNFKDLTIRAVEIEGEPWFAANDVCKALSLYVNQRGQPNVTEACRKLNTDEVSFSRIETPTGGASPKMRIVSESGLYKLIMRSDKPEAKAFQDWVTREVLPAIRKTGGFEQLRAHIEARRSLAN